MQGVQKKTSEGSRGCQCSLCCCCKVGVRSEDLETIIETRCSCPHNLKPLFKVVRTFHIIKSIQCCVLRTHRKWAMGMAWTCHCCCDLPGHNSYISQGFFGMAPELTTPIKELIEDMRHSWATFTSTSRPGPIMASIPPVSWSSAPARKTLRRSWTRISTIGWR